MIIDQYKKLKDHPEIWPIYIGAVCFVLFSVITSQWPASWWFDVRSVYVQDSKAGENILMKVDRSILRDFKAVWSVQVRNVTDHDGSGYIICTASDFGSYVKNSVYPPGLDLDWWTNGGCPTLPAGKYRVHTSWRIESDGVFPSKVVDTKSNVFMVSR